ncbi:hypothetical protein ASF25_04405 [Methylobacterium sp. Leaf100]|nr:hypothetical protein ASF25_04405 [Methylobacterium sp. Leaf100]
MGIRTYIDSEVRMMSRQFQIALHRCEVAAIRLRLALLRSAYDAVKAGFNASQSRDERGRWNGGGGGSGIVVVRRDRTGHPKIDLTSDRLVEVMKEVVANVGTGRGPLYGTAIHTEAAKLIRESDFPGIGRRGVEQSFSLGDTVRYGLDGSIRTDIVLRDGRTNAAPILAVWDVKTGGAKLTPERAAQIRQHLGVGDDVPIVELHISKGLDAKSYIYAMVS